VKFEPRICLLSQRNIYQDVFRCFLYEFEDVICEIDEVHLIAPKPYSSFIIGKKIFNQITRRFSFAYFNPGLSSLRLKRNYDLCIAMCCFPSDLLSLNAIKGLEVHCKKSLCYLSEIWTSEINELGGYLKILSKFDYVVINCSASVQELKNKIQRPCFYFPPGIDTFRFSPYPNPPKRCIDIYSLGRRNPSIHEALLEMADQKKIFYIYDTIKQLKTPNYKEHRSLIANIAKRSRFFLVNAAKIDSKFETHGQSEIGPRFFEGAASGTVMIGSPPKNKAFRNNFNWPDAVIYINYDSPNIIEVLADLNSQPDRLKGIRRNNIVQSLLHHDFVYRWKEILDIVGLEPLSDLMVREERLKILAEEVKKECI